MNEKTSIIKKLLNLFNRNKELTLKALKDENIVLKNKYEAVKANEEKYRILLELAPDAFFQGDSQGNFIVINDKTVELTGYSREELLEMNMADLFPKSILKEQPLRYDLLKTGQTIKIEREIITKKGESIYVEMSSKAMPDGTYQSLMRNITDRKMAQDALVKSEIRLTRAELASKAGNWELHLDSKKMIGSMGSMKLYGVDKDEFGYEFIKNIPLPEYREMMDKALKDLIKDRKPYDIEFKIKSADTGEIKDIHSIAMYDAEKRILFGIIRDITQQKKTEGELIKAIKKAQDSDQLKTVFLQNMSHEIRTPMNAIIGFSDLLTYYFDDKEKLYDFAAIIKHSSSDLLELIDEILDLSKIETGQISMNLEDFDIQEVFEDLYLFFTSHREKINKKHIDLQFELECDKFKKQIRTDKGKLKQIFINLIYNAFKFSDEGRITYGCKLEKNAATFFVSDMGCGIPDEMQDVVFERFMQIKSSGQQIQSGTGLGLSIVKGLVELLGGEISLQSEVGKGSTFFFTINMTNYND